MLLFFCCCFLSLFLFFFFLLFCFCFLFCFKFSTAFHTDDNIIQLLCVFLIFSFFYYVICVCFGSFGNLLSCPLSILYAKSPLNRIWIWNCIYFFAFHSSSSSFLFLALWETDVDTVFRYLCSSKFIRILKSLRGST